MTINSVDQILTMRLRLYGLCSREAYATKVAYVLTFFGAIRLCSVSLSDTTG
jgi:hypothetical protein